METGLNEPIDLNDYVNSTSYCLNHDMVFVKRTKTNGTPLVNKQCLQCGERDSKAYKVDKSNYDTLPTFDENLLNQFYVKQAKTRQEEQELKKKEWFESYNQYLKTDDWQLKRRKVLIRDKFTCQYCLEKEAVEVHHLTYQHVFNEPLFELVSVCFTCHQLITKIDRNED